MVFGILMKIMKRFVLTLIRLLTSLSNIKDHPEAFLTKIESH